MNGTASKDADVLYQGIMEYYAGLSGLEITAAQVATRNNFTAAHGIVCDDSLDQKILAIQDQFGNESNPVRRKVLVLQAIALLTGGG